MQLNRRTLLKSAAAQALFLPALKFSAWADELQNFMLCAKNAAGEFVAVKLTEDGHLVKQFTLADRGHGHAKSSNGDIAIFARRPNNQLYLIDKYGTLRLLYAPEGRHFFGHGAFSPDAKLLYTAENDFDHEDENLTGVIGVWDVKKGIKIGEFPSGGIGVHQIMLMPDGETLALANGGILTHPDHPRQKLNLNDMQPNMAFANRKTGVMSQTFDLPPSLRQLSIRHIDVAANGQVAVAMQYQGKRLDDVPLLATIAEGKLKFSQATSDIMQLNKQYIGSICYDASGQYFAASSPVGGLVSFYHADGRYIAHKMLQDVCAVAKFGSSEAVGTFILATGMGDIYHYDLPKNRLKTLRARAVDDAFYQWDNHMLAL